MSSDSFWPSLLAASERLAGSRSMEAIVQVLRETARQVAQADGIAVVLRDGDFCSYVAEDAVAPLWSGQRFPAASCVSGWAMEHRQSVWIPDIFLDERVPQEAYRPTFVRSLLMVPIGREAGIAALGAYWSQVGAPDEDALAALEGLARAAAIAIENVRLVASIEQSDRDRRIAVAAGRMGVWQLDLAGGELTTSAACRENFGRDPALPFGYQDLREAIHPDDRARVFAAIETSITTGVDYDIEYRLLTPEGRTRWIGIRARTEYDAQARPVSMAGVSIDITERKQSESRLRESEARFRALVQATSDVVYSMSPDWTQMRRLSGAHESPGHGPGEVDWLSTYVLPEDRASARRLVERAIRERSTFRLEHRVPRPDGSIGWVMSHAVPQFDEAGSLIEWLGAATDVTERKHAEAALERSAASLEAEVRERTAELDRAQDALRQAQKLEAMGQLTGGVAHDFNNLLTPIISGLDMLQRRGIGSAGEQRLVAGALQSAERAKLLVQRLLAFARRQPLQATAVDIAAMLEGMGDLVRSTIGPTVQLRFEVAEGLPCAQADVNQLELALLNLAVNARDAMPGGGTLSVMAVEVGIAEGHQPALEPGRYVQLTVADTGVGMSAQTLARAIEPFFSTKGVGKGTGLGLSMVHGLTHQLHGGMKITSKPGFGTAICLWLPVSRLRADEAAVARPVAGQAEPLGTALVVDDEELVRQATAAMMSELGYAVIEAGSATEALAHLERRGRIDVLVTDHLMPETSGVELAHKVRERCPSTVVLVVSGFAEEGGLDADLPRLSKPFRQSELAASLIAARSASVAPGSMLRA